MGNVRGVGIDLVKISELRDLDQRTKGAFLRRSFTEQERQDAASAQDTYVFYEGRFAVKEAVFKAVAHLTEEKTFDFRMVETKRLPDGSPRVVIGDGLEPFLKKAGIDDVLISISNEGEYAVAIAEAISWEASCMKERSSKKEE